MSDNVVSFASKLGKRFLYGGAAVVSANVFFLGLSLLICFGQWRQCPDQSGTPMGFGDGLFFAFTQAVVSIIPCQLVNIGYLIFTVSTFSRRKDWRPFAAFGGFELAWVVLIIFNNTYSCVRLPL